MKTNYTYEQSKCPCRSKKEHLLKLNPVHFDPSEILCKSQNVPPHWQLIGAVKLHECHTKWHCQNFCQKLRFIAKAIIQAHSVTVR